MIASNDTPATDAELDSFYGTPPNQYEIDSTINRQKRAFDADDLATIAQECSGEILNAVENHAVLIGGIFIRERNKLIANRASIELFGRTGVIKPEEV